MKNKQIAIRAVVAATATLLAIAPQQLHAQKLATQWITADLGGGLHSITFKAANGEHKPGVGTTLNIRYMQYLTNEIGVGGGMAITTYKSKSIYTFIDRSDYNDEYVNANGETEIYKFQLRSYLNNMTEKQNILQLELPVGVFYKISNFATNADLLLNAGFRIGIPVWNNYKLVDGKYETRGYSYDLNVELDSMSQHGFTSVKADKQKGKADICKINLALYGEALYVYKLNRKQLLYGGLYMSYAPTNTVKKNSNPVISNGGKYNGTLQSNQVDKAHLLTLGIKIGLMLDFNTTFHINSTRKF